MRYDYVGVELLKLAAFLYVARYIAAALFMGPGLQSWNRSLFAAAYKYVGSDLTIIACISAIVGIAFLVVSARKQSALANSVTPKC